MRDAGAGPFGLLRAGDGDSGGRYTDPGAGLPPGTPEETRPPHPNPGCGGVLVLMGRCCRCGRSNAGPQPGAVSFPVLQNPQGQDKGKNLVAVLQIAVDELGTLADAIAHGVAVDEQDFCGLGQAFGLLR